MRPTLIRDENICTREELLAKKRAKSLTLTDVSHILCSPDSLAHLKLTESSTELTDGDSTYPIINGIPVLFPSCIIQSFLSGGLNLTYYEDPKLQYFLLAQIRQHGEINASVSSIHYQRHLYRIRQLLRDCNGTLLDIGCDDALLGACLLPEGSSYIGLEPFPKFDSTFKILGVGESQPFITGSLDAVLFNTSLDHILDYYQALVEARRVLKPMGKIYISTLIWEEKASLLNDAVHFHHFKRYEIDGVLESLGFKPIYEARYSYKDDRHRYGLYISAQKIN